MVCEWLSLGQPRRWQRPAVHQDYFPKTRAMRRTRSVWTAWPGGRRRRSLHSGTVGDAEDGSHEGLCRTKDVLVIARISNKAAESVDSTALSAKSHNQSANGSELGYFGSPGPSHPRMSFSLCFPLRVRCGRVSTRSEVVRWAGPAMESPGERAERFRAMMASGQFKSQADLARHLGCSQVWVSKVLRRGSDRGPQGP